ncbi:hypothetical protein FSP39_021879 [Pinctada imbricata]|uniref:UspA domain-containing protein n=1 Tax=Pinctada imbricata TaxID=66713 RepID=A0AA88YG06_PINIB|nr:hypothetical protein FSP39_021879 [Pinctada imbricata]
MHIAGYKENIHKHGDHVLIVHCVDHRKHLQYGMYVSPKAIAMAPGNPDSATHAFHREDVKANELLVKTREKMKEFGIEAEFVKMSGDPGECIVRKAEESGAEFIVTGCRGLGTIRRTFMGSVSDYIMHHSDVPVFVCRH